MARRCGGGTPVLRIGGRRLVGRMLLTIWGVFPDAALQRRRCRDASTRPQSPTLPSDSLSMTGLMGHLYAALKGPLFHQNKTPPTPGASPGVLFFSCRGDATRKTAGLSRGGLAR